MSESGSVEYALGASGELNSTTVPAKAPIMPTAIPSALNAPARSDERGAVLGGNVVSCSKGNTGASVGGTQFIPVPQFQHSCTLVSTSWPQCLQVHMA